MDNHTDYSSGQPLNYSSTAEKRDDVNPTIVLLEILRRADNRMGYSSVQLTNYSSMAEKRYDVDPTIELQMKLRTDDPSPGRSSVHMRRYSSTDGGGAFGVILSNSPLRGQIQTTSHATNYSSDRTVY